MRLGQTRFWDGARVFSLVELLVVVAVIAMLMALLLPALGKAKESAKSAVCAASQRQCGLGLQGYSNDFGDWVIAVNTVAGSKASLYFGIAALPNMLMDLGYAPNVRKSPLGGDAWSLPENNIFSCPTLPPPPSYSYAGGTRTGASTVTGYGLRNITLMNFYPGECCDSTFSVIKVNSVYLQCPLVVDSVQSWPSGAGYVGGNGQYGRWSLWSNAAGIHLRHGRGANCWFVDGHVARLGAAECVALKQPGVGALTTTPIVYSY